MKRWGLRVGMVLAVAFLVLTVVNAQWLAPEPKGSVKLVADGGLGQLALAGDSEREPCAAVRIEEPYHAYLENTVAGVLRANKLGAPVVAVDIASTKDGEIVLFGDAELDCRTDGSGTLSEHRLAELKTLDIGHGYSPDGGESFPLRGQGAGQMPTLEETLARLPRRARLMYRFTADDPAQADLLAAKLRAAGRDPVAARDAFSGPAAPLARIRELYPEAWAWNRAEAQECSRDYIALGWTGYLPESCRGGTMTIPLDRQFAYWGWPNRLIARMETHGGRVVVTGPDGGGLTLPEQLGEVPRSFNGYLLVDDAFAIAPALHTRFDDRNQAEIDASHAALQRRRARQ